MPLPPGQVPLVGQGHRHHRLGQQRERGDQAEQHRGRGAPVQQVEAHRGEQVERDRRRRRRRRADPRRRAAWRRLVQRRQVQQRHRGPGRPAAARHGGPQRRPAPGTRARPARPRTAAHDATANTDASASPTGWARSKPGVGVRDEDARAWPARAASRKPALVRNASETRNSRASVWRRAATLIRAPSTTLTAATTRTSQKWLGWCCQTASIAGPGQQQPQRRRRAARGAGTRPAPGRAARPAANAAAWTGHELVTSDGIAGVASCAPLDGRNTVTPYHGRDPAKQLPRLRSTVQRLPMEVSRHRSSRCGPRYLW